MKAAVKLALDLAARLGFAAYGFWAARRAPPPPLPLAESLVQRLLVIRLDLMGDALFSLPAIKALAAAFPRAQVDVLALPYTAPLFRQVPEVHWVWELDVHRYRRPDGWRRLPALVSTLRALRATGYDLAVGLSRRLGGVFAVASGARWRAGYPAETYAGCYNLALAGGRYQLAQHDVDYCLAVARAVGGERARAERQPALTLRSGGEGGRQVEAPFAVIVPGASNGSAKRWPPRYWAELGDRLAELGLTVVLGGGPGEEPLGQAVVQAMRSPAIDLVGRTSVLELAALLQDAAVVLAGDTGPLHLAAALGRPVVGIFGPTDPANTGPLGASTRVVRAGLPCSPCYDLRRPAECRLPDRSQACMWQVRPEQVAATVLVLLQQSERVRA